MGLPESFRIFPISRHSEKRSTSRYFVTKVATLAKANIKLLVDPGKARCVTAELDAVTKEKARDVSLLNERLESEKEARQRMAREGGSVA